MIDARESLVQDDLTMFSLGKHIDLYVALPLVGIAIAIILTIVGWKMNVAAANWLLVLAWLLLIISGFRLTLGEHVIPALLWTMVLGGICGLPMYYFLWTNPATTPREPNTLIAAPTSVVSEGGSVSTMVHDELFEVGYSVSADMLKETSQFSIAITNKGAIPMAIDSVQFMIPDQKGYFYTLDMYAEDSTVGLIQSAEKRVYQTKPIAFTDIDKISRDSDGYGSITVTSTRGSTYKIPVDFYIAELGVLINLGLNSKSLRNAPQKEMEQLLTKSSPPKILSKEEMTNIHNMVKNFLASVPTTDSTPPSSTPDKPASQP